MDRTELIVDQLYDGALDPAAWPAALTAVCELMAADHAIGMVRNDAEATFPFVATARTDPAHIPPFLQMAGGGMAMLRAFPERRAFDFDAVMPRADFLRGALFNEAIRPMGGYRAVMAIPFRHAETDSFLAVCRPERAPEFRSDDIATLERIVPHLARAVRIKLRVDGAEARVDAEFAAFDQIDAGLAIVDRDMRPLALNRRLERILLQGDGLALSHKALTARDRAANQALHALVRRAASDDPRVPSSYTMLLRRPAGRPPWTVTVRRLEPRRMSGDSGLVVLLIDDVLRAPGKPRACCRGARHHLRHSAHLSQSGLRQDAYAAPGGSRRPHPEADALQLAHALSPVRNSRRRPGSRSR